MERIDIFRAFHRKTSEYTFFSSAYRTFSRIDYILGHKLSLGKFKKIEISGILSDYSLMGLDFNYREKPVKSTNTWRLSNMILNN